MPSPCSWHIFVSKISCKHPLSAINAAHIYWILQTFKAPSSVINFCRSFPSEKNIGFSFLFYQRWSLICFHVPRRNSMPPGKKHLVINDSLLKLKKNKFLVTPLLTLSSILTWKPCSLYGKYVCHHRIKREQQAKFNNYVETLIISNHISSCSPKSKIKSQFSKSLQDGLGFQFEWAGILIIALTFFWPGCSNRRLLTQTQRIWVKVVALLFLLQLPIIKSSRDFPRIRSKRKGQRPFSFYAHNLKHTIPQQWTSQSFVCAITIPHCTKM